MPSGWCEGRKVRKQRCRCSDEKFCRVAGGGNGAGIHEDGRGKEKRSQAEDRVAPRSGRWGGAPASPGLARWSWAQAPCACPTATLVTAYVRTLARTSFGCLQKVGFSLRLQALVNVTRPLGNFTSLRLGRLSAPAHKTCGTRRDLRSVTFLS